MLYTRSRHTRNSGALRICKSKPRADDGHSDLHRHAACGPRRRAHAEHQRIRRGRHGIRERRNADSVHPALAYRADDVHISVPERRGGKSGHVPPNLTTLATVLKGHGYQTAAFIGSIFLERQLGLDQGFDTYDSPFSFEAFSKLSGSMLFAGGPHNAYSVRERRPGALVLLAAKRWMAATEPAGFRIRASVRRPPALSVGLV